MSTFSSLPPSYNSSLPSYSVNFEVQRADPDILYLPLQITIFDRQPVYDLGDIIQGMVTIVPTHPVNLNTLLVLLECAETTQLLRWVSDNDKRRSATISFHRIPLPDNRELLPDFVYTFPFSIQVPETKTINLCKRNFSDHMRLPPSISGFDGSPAKGPISIQYNLHAAMSTDIGNHEHAYAPIFMLPSYTLSLNAQRRVNTTSIHTAVQKHRTRLTLRRSATNNFCTQIRLDKLPPLPVSASTIVPILLTSFGGNNIPPAIATITAKLVSYTVYSGQGPFETSPPMTYAPGNLDYSTMLVLAKFTPANPTWKREEDVNTGQLSNMTVLNLPVTIPELIPPTFESCYISRVYSLIVAVKLEGERYPLEIEVPVNLVSPNPPRNMIISTAPEKDRESRDDSLNANQNQEYGLPSYSR